MPRFDGSGPMGQGPMGRGLGPCGAGRGSGGFGRGFRGCSNFQGGWNRPRCGGGGGGNVAPQWGSGYAAPQDEVQALKQEAAYRQNELEAIQKRLSELQGD